MFNLGVPELLLIMAVALIVFGPRKLPEIGRTLGKALGEFRRATDDLKNSIEREVRLEELKQIGPTLVPFEPVSRNEPLHAAPGEDSAVEAPAPPEEPAPVPSETR